MAFLDTLHSTLAGQVLGDKPTHKCRELLEPLVFHYMRKTYLPDLRKWWETYEPPASAKRSIVVYETRKHEQLEFLLMNLCYFAQGWALTVYCSEENLDFLKAIVGSKAVSLRVLRSAEGEYDVERNTYNTVLKSRAFWEGLQQFEHVLLAEVDSYLTSHVELILDLEEYDYIAAKWIWNPTAPGGGGLSIRRVSHMLKVCELSIDEDMQDAWVSKGIQEIGGCVGNAYFSESVLVQNLVGVHQWWAFYFQYYLILDQHPELLQFIEKLYTLKL